MSMWSIHFGSESGNELHNLVLPFDRIVSFSMTTVQTGNPFHSGADPVVLYLLRRELQSVGRGRSTLRTVIIIRYRIAPNLSCPWTEDDSVWMS